MTSSRDTVLLFGRILMATIFVISGFHKITAFGGTVDQIAGKGVPLATVAAVVAIVVELGGGLSVLFGVKSRIGAWVLFVFLIPTTLLFHNFWAYGGQQFQMQMITFMKNLAIMGGLLFLSVSGSGRLAAGSD